VRGRKSGVVQAVYPHGSSVRRAFLRGDDEEKKKKLILLCTIFTASSYRRLLYKYRGRAGSNITRPPCTYCMRRHMTAPTPA